MEAFVLVCNFLAMWNFSVQHVLNQHVFVGNAILFQYIWLVSLPVNLNEKQDYIMAFMISFQLSSSFWSSFPI